MMHLSVVIFTGCIYWVLYKLGDCEQRIHRLASPYSMNVQLMLHLFYTCIHIVASSSPLEASFMHEHVCFTHPCYLNTKVSYNPSTQA